MRVLNFLVTVAELELVRAGGSELAVSSESAAPPRAPRLNRGNARKL